MVLCSLLLWPLVLSSWESGISWEPGPWAAGGGLSWLQWQRWVDWPQCMRIFVLPEQWSWTVERVNWKQASKPLLSLLARDTMWVAASGSRALTSPQGWTVLWTKIRPFSLKWLWSWYSITATGWEKATPLNSVDPLGVLKGWSMNTKYWSVILFLTLPQEGGQKYYQRWIRHPSLPWPSFICFVLLKRNWNELSKLVWCPPPLPCCHVRSDLRSNEMYLETLCSLTFIHVSESGSQRLFLNSLQRGCWRVSIFKAKGLRSAATHKASMVQGDPSSLGSGELLEVGFLSHADIAKSFKHFNLPSILFRTH